MASNVMLMTSTGCCLSLDQLKAMLGIGGGASGGNAGVNCGDVLTLQDCSGNTLATVDTAVDTLQITTACGEQQLISCVQPFPLNVCQ